MGVVKLFHSKGTEVDDQAGRLQPPKHLFHIPLVLLHGWAGYNDIVKIDESESQPGQHAVHEPLEGAPGVAQPEGEAQELEEAKRRDDGGL